MVELSTLLLYIGVLWHSKYFCPYQKYSIISILIPQEGSVQRRVS